MRSANHWMITYKIIIVISIVITERRGSSLWWQFARLLARAIHMNRVRAARQIRMRKLSISCHSNSEAWDGTHKRFEFYPVVLHRAGDANAYKNKCNPISLSESAPLRASIGYGHLKLRHAWLQPSPVLVRIVSVHVVMNMIQSDIRPMNVWKWKSYHLAHTYDVRFFLPVIISK